MRISIRHELSFAQIEGVGHAVHHLLLCPRDTSAQTVEDWTISAPGIDGAARFADAFGNVALMTAQTRPEDDLFISVSGTVETRDTNGVIGRLATDPVTGLFRRITGLTKPNGTLVNRLKSQTKSGASRLDLFHWLMNRLHESYIEPDAEDDGGDRLADCMHEFIAAVRGLDIPARFVTGYVLAEETGAARLHFWAEAWDEGLGWIGFDPANNLCPTEAYVRLACGLDLNTAVPVRLVPALEKRVDDVVRISQVMMNQQQQQQSGSQKQ